jgi:hypothetical protein
MDIQVGAVVEVETADGSRARMRALTGPVSGRDFQVVWVCRPESFDEYRSDYRAGIPWPAEAVREVAPAQ